jgi:hypothetical protein
MKRFYNVLAVAALGIAGLWGCSPTPSTGGSSERIRSLEVNLRNANEGRDQLASRLQATEAKGQSLEREVQRLQGLLQDTTRERDDAQAATKLRTAERDLSQSQYDTFRKSLKEMLAQAETAQSVQKIDPSDLFSSPMLPPIQR